MQGPRDPAHGRLEKTLVLRVEIRNGLIRFPEGLRMVVEWNGYFLLAGAVHSSARAFRNSTHVLS